MVEGNTQENHIEILQWAERTIEYLLKSFTIRSWLKIREEIIDNKPTKDICEYNVEWKDEGLELLEEIPRSWPLSV